MKLDDQYVSQPIPMVRPNRWRFRYWHMGAIGIALILLSALLERAYAQEPIPVKYEFKATITYKRAVDGYCSRGGCSDHTEGPITLLRYFNTERECLETVRLFESMGLTIPTNGRPPSVEFKSVCTISPQKKESK